MSSGRAEGVQAEVDGERLSDAEIASFFILLATAGNETTRNAISHGVLELTRHPDQRDRWWSDFDGLARDPNPQVGYGAGGPHFCLGANLARREITMAFRELVEQVPDIYVVDEPEMLRWPFIHGVKRLDCEFTAT